ncbi:MAG: DUF1697 domain-containing protein [Bacteroidales bacterium]|nr:DUF1697 domain-containing protein [Bacteroidales bacterium]
MKSYIALLRGVNVSGKNIIRMNVLLDLITQLGFTNVQTYIQSGNIIFRHDEMPLDFFENKIHAAIKNNFGIDVPVIAMDREYLGRIISGKPFAEVDESKLMVTFLAHQPEKEKVDAILEIINPPDILIQGNKAFYLYCPEGFGKTRITNNFLETKLGVSMTGRNWKTCNRLFEMTV